MPIAPLLARRQTRRPRRRPESNVHEIPIRRLPAELDGLRIAHVTDVHVQRMVRPRHLDRAVEWINDTRPDLLCLTGDYVCFHRGAIPRLHASLGRLRAEVQAVAVLGNHDHWCDAAGIRHVLEDLGIRVLQNEHTHVEVRGGRLAVVGVDDASTGNADPARAFAGLEDSGAPVIALTHDPRAAEPIAAHGAELILAGHTHGGQIVVGNLTHRIAARLGHFHLDGFYEVGEQARLFVNRGLGASLPVRVNAPPEVAKLILRSDRA